MKSHSFRFLSNFRLQLSLVFGGLFLLATLLDIAIEPFLNETLIENKGEALLSTAQIISKSLDMELLQREQKLRLRTLNKAFSTASIGSQALKNELAQIKQENPDIKWLGIIAEDGKLATALGTKPSPYIEYAVSIYDDAGALRGTLVAQSSWSWVSAMIAELLPRNSAEYATQVFIVNQQNIALFSTSADEPTALPAPLVNQRYRQEDWPDGTNYLYTEAKIENPAKKGWRVLIRESPPQFLASFHRLRSELTLPSLIITLLLVVLVYRIAASISSPLEALVSTAQRISAGEEHVEWKIDASSHEFNKLSLAIRQMATTLLARRGELAAINASLEKKVEERTEALSEANRQLAERATLLEQMARSDALTGLGNRMAAAERLTAEYQRFRRSHAPYAVLLMDADHFKRVNDTYGHAVGDQVLQQIAATLHSVARTTDFAARYGGEEFLLLLPDTDAEGTMVLAERVRTAISAASDTVAGVITVSIGAASAQEEDDTHETIVQRADEALYRAKANGRNRVEGAE